MFPRNFQKSSIESEIKIFPQLNVSIQCALFICSLTLSDSLQPHGLQPTSLLCPWGFSRQKYWSGLPCLLPGDLPTSGMEPRPPVLQAYSLPAEPPEKPKNTGVGSLSLLQGNFLTQESTWGLLHCSGFFTS